MKPRVRWVCLAVWMVLCVSICQGQVNQGMKFSTVPVLNHGEKWQIGYCQGGDFDNYYRYLSSTVYGLMDLGWIKHTTLPVFEDNQTRPFWNWLADHIESEYIQFVSDAYYSANWDQEARNKTSARLIQRLNQKKDIDLMIAMGTWAGTDLANQRHQVKTLVMSTSDPVKSGIIKSYEDSGLDHIHARVDPFRYERQIQVFHRMVGFKTLGVAFEDSENGRAYAAVETIEKAAGELGFKVVKCYTQSDIADQDLAGQSVINCFRRLVDEVDAIYVTLQGGLNSMTRPELVKMALEKKIPTFSQLGAKEVRQGFLLSMSRKGGFKSAGRYFAALVSQIFNGALPRELSQVFEEQVNFAINLKTAERIGFYLHADMIAAADEIYHDIEAP